MSSPLRAESPGDAPITGAKEKPPIVLTDRARQIHERGILIDGHNDLPWQMRALAEGSFDNMDISVHQEKLHTDIPRLKKGGLDAQFWVVYVPADTPQDGSAKKQALEQFDLVERMIKRYPETFERALSADDIVRIHGKGKIASMVGVEGGHMIENSLDNLRHFYKLGARYMGLTHSDSID
ncbi:MAG: membrane dipeptidase, partial [Planctomycetes bacterium]|nr:membrane dipeptidase [Planctomycetota bacterium]